MRKFAIVSDRLVLPSGIDGFGYLIIEDGRFGQVSVTKPDDMPIVDRTGCWVAPGLVDTHIHGFASNDVMDASVAGLAEISRGLARVGTTSWLATTMSAMPKETEEACAAAGEFKRSQQEKPQAAAHMAGIYLEGPFFTAPHKGAQDVRTFCDPDLALLDSWQEAAGGAIVKSALAPERTGSVAYIAGARERGVTCALGHSAATYGEAAAAVLAGAKVVNHTFNGMDDMDHRNPGIVGLAMTSKGLFAELICDGVHVDPVAVDALVRAKGFEHVCLITDCLRQGGLGRDELRRLDVPIEVRGGAAYIGGTETLAGSILTLAKAVKNVCDWGVVTAEQAIRMATEVAARSVGLDGVCGEILPGRLADLTVLDRGLDLVETYVAGERVE